MEIKPVYIQKLILTQFRNYKYQYIDFVPEINILTGQNGMGKTNILDAIYLLCLGKSYFNAVDSHIMMHNTDFYRLESKIAKGDSLDKVVIKSQSGKRKEIEVSDKKLTKIKEHVGQFPVVIIAPDDIHDLLNTSEERRNYINNTLVQFDGQYLDDLMTYTALLKQRNAALKSFQETKTFNPQLLEAISIRMYQPAENIFRKRKEFIENVSQLFFDIYSDISDQNELCQLEYQSPIDGSSLEIKFKESLEKDKVLGRTNVGIHKDDLVFTMNNKPLKTYGSQGQLKSFILALKIAQYHYLKNKKQLKPILLLDDIFDKLDPHRVRHLINIVSSEDFGQVFITDTQKERIHTILDSLNISHRHQEVHNGAIIQNLTK